MSVSEPLTRPRVEGDREQEILDACLEVLADVGYDRLTMDAVATRAKASKATLYRRWDSKAGLVLDAFTSVKGPLPEAPDTGTLRDDLIALHCGHGGLQDPHQLAIFTAVLTALGRDPEFAEQFRREFLGPRLALTLSLYERARDRGEIRDEVNLELVAPSLVGVVMHRQLLLGHPATAESITEVIDHLILPALAPPSPPKDPS